MQNSFGSLDELFNDNWNLLNQQPQQTLDLDFWLTADLPNGVVEEKDHADSKQVVDNTKRKRKERPVLDEEERRRRNTLASQKFRAEKKKKDSEMLEINKKLQERIAQLESELKDKQVEINVLRKLILNQ